MLPTDPRILWSVQLRLECKAVNDTGRIVRVPGDNPDEIATCSAVRFVDGDQVVFCEDADDDLIARTSLLEPGLFFLDTELAAQTVAGGRPTAVGRFHTYVFPETERRHPGVVRTGAEEYACVVDGRAVSWASSARSNSDAAELWVRTDPAFQRQGHGRRVAHAWAAEVMSAGKVAFYSHLHGNHASRRLAAPAWRRQRLRRCHDHA
ncbi:hypothetical protein ABN028_26670 [Actinopolymorpha sp. B17G11]|uniref:GNAT family N-acetyltransferase n=1 Tax=Actinopolymorpha sp. B17G11 TaxID=3160861 RepID=UPI0032E47207